MAPKVQSLKAGDVVEVATWRFGEEYARANGAGDDWEFDDNIRVESHLHFGNHLAARIFRGPGQRPFRCCYASHVSCSHLKCVCVCCSLCESTSQSCSVAPGAPSLKIKRVC